MNFKELIIKLFKSQEKHYGLALPTDLVSVPTRDSLDDNKIKTLDEYKDNYLEILSQKKHFTSRDIESVDFNQEMIMNFELFGRLVINHDSDYNLSTMADYERNELLLRQKVIPRKIKLYIDKMESMFNETHLRLIALKEIYSEIGKKLSKDKQNAILNDIYNLTSKYIIFKNNVYAALKEVETYKAEILTSSIIKNETIENDVLNMHESDLTSFASYFIPKTLDTINKSNLDAFDKMAYLERELEIYAYNNLKIDDLNQELEKIDKIEKTPSNRKLLLEMINELEIKYLVLNDYGGHELDLKPLYEVKFDILTIDIVKQEESPFKDISYYKELKYYEDIILDRITTNITGVDSLLNQRLDDDNRDIINCIVELLKVNGKYDYKEILKNRLKISLILSTVSDGKMNYFFDNYLNDLHSYSDMPVSGIYNDNFLSLNDKVPLSTVLRINLMSVKVRHDNNSIIRNSARIYEFFSSKIQNNSSEYRIPEGICEIVLFSDNDIHNINDEIREYLINKVRGKTMIMPSTLKKLHDYNDIFHHVAIPNVVLNEGLKYFSGYFPFDCFGTKTITIPSTLLNIKFHRVDTFYHSLYRSFEELRFTNFENSLILHDKEKTSEIIRTLLELMILDFIFELKMATYPINKNTSVVRKMRIILLSQSGTYSKIDLYEIFMNNIEDNNDKIDTAYDTPMFRNKVINEIKEEIEDIMAKKEKSSNHKNK